MMKQKKSQNPRWYVSWIRRALRLRLFRLRSHVVVKCLFCESGPGQQHEPQCPETGVVRYPGPAAR